MAKRVVLIADDISGVATPEAELKEIEYVHPVSGKTYVLMTTEDNFAKFSAKVVKEADKMTEVKVKANEAFEAARKLAREVYDKAMEEAAAAKDATTADLGAPLEGLIAKSAKGYTDWEEKKTRGARASGSGDPQRARDIAVGRARSAFLDSDAALELGGKQMAAFIKHRRTNRKGRINETLNDWLESEDIRPQWHPDEKATQGTLV